MMSGNMKWITSENMKEPDGPWVGNRLSINLNVILIELSSPKSPVRNAGILTIECGVQPGILTAEISMIPRRWGSLGLGIMGLAGGRGHKPGVKNQGGEQRQMLIGPVKDLIV
jgi:hypothetical protein